MPDATDTDNETTDPTSAASGDGTPPPPAATEDPPAPNADDDLGEAGRKALDAERKARRDAEALAKRQQAELDELRKSQLSEQERAVEEAREAGRAEVRTEANRRLVEAEARAAAAGRLANPALASKLLDLEQFIPSDGSDIDGDAIAAAIDELVTAEPYLGVSQTPPAGDPPPPAPKGTVTAGAQSGTPATFKRSQLRDPQFYAANKDAILKAASEGRITND